LEGAGEDGAFEPLKEERREDDCFSLSTGGGGNIDDGGKEGVDATDVAGVNGPPASLLEPEIEPEKSIDASSLEGNSLATDSASLAVLSRLYIPGRLLARADGMPSLTVLEVRPCLRPDLAEPPILMFKFVFLPMAWASNVPCLFPDDVGVEMR
jgi:hypothetical protein